MSGLQQMQQQGQDVQAQLVALGNLVEEKLGIKPEAVMEKYEAAKTKLGTELPDLDEAELNKRAYASVKSEFKSQLRSPANFFQGVVLGVTDTFDMIASQRKTALAVWQVNQDKAIEDGLTDKNGVPLDTRQNFSTGTPNKNFGEPLPEHANIQNLIGIATVDLKGELQGPQLFRMPLGEELAGKLDVLQNTPVAFRANIPDRQPKEGEWKLNPYRQISFDPADNSDYDNIEEIFDTWPQLNNYRILLKDLPERHAEIASDPQRFIVTIADVQYLAPEPNAKTGNLMMVLDDDSLPVDHSGYTAWIPPHLMKNVDFGPGSRLFVMASTVETDYEGGSPHLLNVMGFYAIPKFKTNPEENPRSAVSSDAQQVE